MQRKLFNAAYFPVHLEPITHSGERITIAVALNSEELREIRVEPIFSQTTAVKVFGEMGKQLCIIADQEINHLRKQLANNDGTPLVPFFQGVYYGTPRQIKHSDIQSMLRAAVHTTSSLNDFGKTKSVKKLFMEPRFSFIELLIIYAAATVLGELFPNFMIGF